MSNLRIAPRNFLDLMTLSGDVAPAAGFEYVNMQNTLRSSFWRSPDATGQYLRWSLAAGSIIHNWLALFRHHCHGGSLRYRAWANNNWTGTLLVDTGTNAIYTPITTGHDHGYDDASGIDTHDPLGLESAYSVFFLPGGAAKSGQIDFSSKSTTYGYPFWEVGRPFIGNYFEPARSATFGLQYGIGDGTESVRSRGGSLITGQGARWKTMDMDFNGINEDEMPTWVDIMEQNQTSRDIALSIFPGQGGRKERDHTVNAKMLSLDALGRPASVLTKKLKIVGC